MRLVLTLMEEWLPRASWMTTVAIATCGLLKSLVLANLVLSTITYDKTRKDRLVILSRFANFLELVPSNPPQGTHALSSDSQ